MQARSARTRISAIGFAEVAEDVQRFQTLLRVEIDHIETGNGDPL
ncbi:MAG: hypothetical protein ACREX4_11560 [Gammaproteobacteria bacterium]